MTAAMLAAAKRLRKKMKATKVHGCWACLRCGGHCPICVECPRPLGETERSDA